MKSTASCGQNIDAIYRSNYLTHGLASQPLFPDVPRLKKETIRLSHRHIHTRSTSAKDLLLSGNLLVQKYLPCTHLSLCTLAPLPPSHFYFCYCRWVSSRARNMHTRNPLPFPSLLPLYLSRPFSTPSFLLPPRRCFRAE